MRPPASMTVPCPGCGQGVRVPIKVRVDSHGGRLVRVVALSLPFTHECKEEEQHTPKTARRRRDVAPR